MDILRSDLLLAALLLLPTRSVVGQAAVPSSIGVETEPTATNAPERDLGLVIVARSTLVGLAALGLLAYARRKQVPTGLPDNEHGLRLAPVEGRRPLADRLVQQTSRTIPYAREDVTGSILGETVERRARPSDRRVTATLDADLTDATGQVVIPVGTIVELTVTERIQPARTPSGYGTLTLDVTGVRVLGHPDSSRNRRGTIPHLGQQGRMRTGKST